MKDEDYTQLMDDYAAEEEAFHKKVSETLMAILATAGPTAKQDFDDFIDGCRITHIPSVVEVPEGSEQNESSEAFSSVFVDQWSVGNTGDSYAGEIYLKLGEKKWLKIPYDC